MDDSVVQELFAQARRKVPLEFEARYDESKIEIVPIVVWERDDTFYVVLRGERHGERWLECMRIIPYQDGHGVGHFVSVDKVVEV